MKLEDFAIGDILYHPSWHDITYEVLSIQPNGTLNLINKKTNIRADWNSYANIFDLEITKAGVARKTPVERKIANLYKLFEERNK